MERREWKKPRNKERGRKNKWRDKKICGFMLHNIELFVQVWRLWWTPICFEIYIDLPCYWRQALKLHHEWWYNVIVPRTKITWCDILLPLLSCAIESEDKCFHLKQEPLHQTWVLHINSFCSICTVCEQDFLFFGEVFFRLVFSKWWEKDISLSS